MKRLILGVVLALASFGAAASDEHREVKETAKIVCKNSNIKVQTACEEYVNATISSAFTSGMLAGACVYEIQLNKNQEEVQACKNKLNRSDIQQYFELDEESKK